MLDDFIDFARTPVVLIYFCIVLPVSLCLGPKTDSVPLDFKAYRLQHFDLQGNLHGSRSWRISYEAAALGSRNLLRRCLIIWWRDLINRSLQDLLDKTLGAVVILVPTDLDGLNGQDLESFMELERQLVTESFELPVLFAPATPKLQQTLHALQRSRQSEQESAFSALLNAVMANAFQIVSTNQASTAKVDQAMYNIVAKLSAYERSSEVPTIAIVAHYDSFGGAPSLSFGADSNGSGVAALLELSRLLHKLYQSAKTRAKYNLVFILTAGGKLNYQGSRQWIEEQWESAEGLAHQQLDFVLCLEALAKGNGLHAHVSKLPKDDSGAARFLNRLEKAAKSRNKTITIVTKKINLGDEFLAWEHERYSIRKLPAFTLSHMEGHKDDIRRSIMDTKSRLDMNTLHDNVAMIAEALSSYIYDLPDLQSNGRFVNIVDGVRLDLLDGWMDVLSSTPRSSQILSAKGTKDPLIADLLNALDHHSHDAQTTLVQVDKKDPEYMLYGGTDDLLMAYHVKPAIFDLLLALSIAAYLGIMYFVVLNGQIVLQYLQTQIVKLKSS